MYTLHGVVSVCDIHNREIIFIRVLILVIPPIVVLFVYFLKLFTL